MATVVTNGVLKRVRRANLNVAIVEEVDGSWSELVYLIFVDITIRPATADDVPLVLQFIKALGDYEKLAHQVVATEAGLRDALFGSRPDAEVVIAFAGGEPAGFALFFHNFSTFLGRRGLYLEDLFVKAEWRGHGVGKRLLIHLARLAVERNCGRFEWAVLDWNEPAIEFYRRLGAQPLHEWTVFRVTGDELHELAGVEPNSAAHGRSGSR
ncbi:MAG: N-acetyltransferase [Acidobacteria bacterium]|nr:MAG: N-acetyltransferase [Acidobacteriota bacterium]